MSRPPPETCSALQPAASAISPGNSPNPKRTSLQSVSVSASQSVTNLSFSPLNLQNSSVSISSEGGHANPYGYSYHSAYPPCSPYHSAYSPYSLYPYQTPMYPFPSLLPTNFSSQTPPNMTPHPEPTTKDSSPGTLKFINNRISKCQGCKGQMKTAGASLPPPLLDLIVSQMECRPFRSPDNSIQVPSNQVMHIIISVWSA